MHRLFLGLLCVAAVGAPASVFLACSGSTASPGTAPDGGGDATMDANKGMDVTSDTSMGIDTSTGDTNVPPMDAGADTATGCAANDASRAKCTVCCDMEFGDAALAYAAMVNECACATDLCGPTASASDPDASDGAYGTGACTVLCGGDGGKSDPACNACRAETLKGGMDGGDAGPCRSVLDSCEANSACAAYLTCAATCKPGG